MSENSPQPEQWRMFDSCDNCGATYSINQSNSFITSFSKQPDVNILNSSCDSCTQPSVFYLTHEVAEQAKDTGVYSNDTEGYAPKLIYEQFLKAMDITLIKEHKITPRQELRVKFIRFLLQHDLIDFNNEGDLSI